MAQAGGASAGGACRAGLALMQLAGDGRAPVLPSSRHWRTRGTFPFCASPEGRRQEPQSSVGVNVWSVAFPTCSPGTFPAVRGVGVTVFIPLANRRASVQQWG